MIAILKINCPSVRKRLLDAGIKLCLCCKFDGSVWLTAGGHSNCVHGEGYPIEEMELYNVEDVLSTIEKSSNYIDYGYNVDRFIDFCKGILNKN